MPSRKPIYIAVACALLTAAAVADAASQPLSQQVSARGIRLAQATTSFNLPEQPLADSLRAVAGQTNSNIIFDRSLVQGIIAKPLQAELSIGAALTELLKGTALVFRSVDDRTVMIVSRQSTSQTGTLEKSGRLRLAQNDAPGSSNEGADAPQSSSAPESAVMSSLTLEEIVVTAQKRVERIQDVPIAISSLSGELLEQASVTGLTDLDRMVPNLLISKGSNTFSSITIRGISGSSRNAGVDDRMSVYLDGAWLGQSQTIGQGLLDLERVEVLRGPQGTLFGKNTVAGAINLITRKPSDRFEGNVTVDYGNYSHRRVAGTVSVPVVDGLLAVKLSAMNTRTDGYYTNLATGNDLDSENETAGRVQLRYTPSESVDINLSVDARRSRRDAATSQLLTDAPFTVSNETDNEDNTDVEGAILSADFLLGNGGTITSISSFRRAEAFGDIDEDHTSFPPPAPSFTTNFAEDNEHFTQELRYTSVKGERFDYVTGVYYQNEDRAAYHTVDHFGLPFFPAPSFTAFSVSDGRADVETYAAFAHGNYRITPAVTLTAGLRYTVEHKDVRFDMVDNSRFFDNIPNYRDSKSESNWSPKLGVNVAITPDVMAYVSASRSYKSGGWNLDFLAPGQIQRVEFDPEFVNAYEAGLKSELLDKRLRTNLVLFHSDYEDYQVFQSVFPQAGCENLPPPRPVACNPILAVTNAGKVRSRGVELELAAQPIRNFTLGTSVGYLDGVYTSFKNGGGIGVDYDGNRLYAPKWSTNVSLDYLWPLALGSLQAFANWSYHSQTYGGPNNDPRSQTGSWDLLSARIGYVSPNDRWNVSLWGENLLNEEYLITKGGTFLGARIEKFGWPRTYGVSVKVSF